MEKKKYYVIQNKQGMFFKIDNWTGGYPSFIDDFEHCEKYESEDIAKAFLRGKYATEMFAKEFDGARVRTVELSLL